MGYFDDPRHRNSESLAFEAEQALRQDDVARARLLYGEAAVLGEELASSVSADSPRLRSLFAINAVSLWLYAEKWVEASRAACMFLSNRHSLTDDAVHELRTLCERAWQAEEIASAFKGDPRVVPFEARYSGGRVGYGFVASRIVSDRRETLNGLLVRTAELIEGRPFRQKGVSVTTSRIQVIEAQPIASSYALRFYLAPTLEQPFEEVQATPSAVANKLIELASLVSDDPKKLSEAIDDRQYAAYFLTAFKALAPDGEDVERLNLTTNTSSPRSVYTELRADSRARIDEYLKEPQTPTAMIAEGVLKSVTLFGNTPRIAIQTTRGSETFHLADRRHEDLLGPLLNQWVRVEALRNRTRKGQVRRWLVSITGR